MSILMDVSGVIALQDFEMLRHFLAAMELIVNRRLTPLNRRHRKDYNRTVH